jgi:predicted enzyme related to lactoylglutathione lyase
MIRGIHGLLYSSDPAATRRFFRDKVRLPGSDIGGGWWIFDFAEGDLGVHPADDDGANTGSHDVSFYCDDIQGTVADLSARGVEFTQPVADRGYGRVTYFTAPGGLKVQLYEPRYQKGAAAKPARTARAAKTVRAAKKAGKKAAPKPKSRAPKRATKARKSARAKKR